MKRFGTLLGCAVAFALCAPALADTPAPQASPSGGVLRDVERSMWNLLLDLKHMTSVQRQHLEAIRARYERDFPPGTFPNHDQIESLRQQVMQVLTPVQQDELRSELQQFRVEHLREGLPDASPSPIP